MIGKHASLKQSVCRQCFNLCDNRTNAGKLECFGSSDTKNGHQKIQQKLATQSASGTFQLVFPWHPFYRQTDAETTDVLGNLRKNSIQSLMKFINFSFKVSRFVKLHQLMLSWPQSLVELIMLKTSGPSMVSLSPTLTNGLCKVHKP